MTPTPTAARPPQVVRVSEFHRPPTVALALGGVEIPGKTGVTVEVVVGDDRLLCSRLAGETAWTIDGHFMANGCPIFYNGEGARFTVLVRPGAELTDLLDVVAGAVAA